MSGPGSLSVWRRLSVVAIAAALLTASLGATSWADLRWDGSALPFHVPWWTLAPAYLVTYRISFSYQYRSHSRDFFVSHVPMVIGLVFVPPLVAPGRSSACGGDQLHRTPTLPVEVGLQHRLGMLGNSLGCGDPYRSGPHLAAERDSVERDPAGSARV